MEVTQLKGLNHCARQTAGLFVLLDESVMESLLLHPQCLSDQEISRVFCWNCY